MRILVLSNLYPPYYLGGYELRCQDVVNCLRDRGHTVWVVTSTYGVGKPTKDEHVYRVLRSRWDSLRTPQTRRQRLFAEVYNNMRLRQTITRVGPEVISCWNMLGISNSLVATAQGSGVPVVFHIEDDWMLREDPWLKLWSNLDRSWARAVKSLIRPVVDRVVPTMLSPYSGTYWVFISEYRKRQHVCAGLPVADAPVIYGGIPVDLFQGRRFEQFSFARPPRRMLFVGVLTHQKGAHLGIEALAQLQRDGHRDLTLTIVGQSINQEYTCALKQSVQDKALSEQVRFIGAVDRAELPAIFSQHDLLLFTSTVPEGFPLTILEAMASGLVIVSNVNGGHGEILKDGENALTYPCADASILAQCIKRLIDQPYVARSLAEAGYRLVRREFTLDRMADKYEYFLGRVIEGVSSVPVL